MSNAIRRAVVGVLLTLLATLALTGSAHARWGGHGFEVWAVDQSNSPGKTTGGTLYIYDGGSLKGPQAAQAQPERIDLGGSVEALCAAQTGTAPVRPHMLLFDASNNHAVLSFVASGHVVFIDTKTRAPLACIDVGIQAHAAVPSPDGRYVVVANQNGKQVQRIATNYRTRTFTLEPAAALDLATGTTPTGAPREDPVLRPDNAPICPIVDHTSRFAFVTLRGGGLFVLDIRSTPMRIVAEYDRTTVHGNGCGGVEAPGKMYINSGGGTAANLAEFDVYSFPMRAFSMTPSPPNTPAPRTVVSQDDRPQTDAHGMALVMHGRDLWVADRSGNRIVVISTWLDRVVGEFSLIGPLSDDPSPDLIDVAPHGDRAFVSLRGRLPLSGDPHASTGSTPGVGVLRVKHWGRSGELEGIAPISNVDSAGVERADPHGIRVRRVK